MTSSDMQVVVPSSASQIFHLLRRQMIRPYRKPLIIMSPKSLLRNKQAMSPLSDFTDGKFMEVIGDAAVTGAKRVVISSGKLHWELTETREKAQAEGKLQDVALIRLEQLYPFPHEALQAELTKHPGAEVIWAQEEPYNQGAWLMIRDDLEAAVQSGQKLTYAGRPRSASTAVGYKHLHDKEQARVIQDALGTYVEPEQIAVKAEATPQS